jgi:hypothetical protein
MLNRKGGAAELQKWAGRAGTMFASNNARDVPMVCAPKGQENLAQGLPG